MTRAQLSHAYVIRAKLCHRTAQRCQRWGMLAQAFDARTARDNHMHNARMARALCI